MARRQPTRLQQKRPILCREPHSVPETGCNRIAAVFEQRRNTARPAVSTVCPSQSPKSPAQHSGYNPTILLRPANSLKSGVPKETLVSTISRESNRNFLPSRSRDLVRRQER